MSKSSTTIENLTIKEAKEKLAEYKELQAVFGIKEDANKQSNGEHPYKLNKSIIIRTVTMTQVGNLVAVYDKELVLTKASWVADVGRFAKALKEGTLEEVEIFNPDEEVIVGRGAIVDCTAWNHDLPTETK
jgi:hypothetical protein